MKIDVQTLSVRELDSLLKAAERRKQILSKRRPIPVVRKELTEVAARHGYAIEELFDLGSTVTASPSKPATKRKSRKVAAKYRDPENRRNTWSGRGRMPRWLAFRLKLGQQQADFLIPGLAKPTQKKSNAIGKRSVYKQPDATAQS